MIKREEGGLYYNKGEDEENEGNKEIYRNYRGKMGENKELVGKNSISLSS